MPSNSARQSAIVDLISSGCVDLGLGAGYRVPEFELFGASMERRYGATDGCARELRRLWDVVTPRPAQERLPIWMGYQGPQGARRAGVLGESLLSIDQILIYFPRIFYRLCNCLLRDFMKNYSSRIFFFEPQCFKQMP